MAINPLMRAALKALSYPDIDLKKNYKLVRQAENLSHTPLIRLYQTWEHEVRRGEHVIPVRLFAPEGRTGPLPVLLFFHGGGWVTGNIDSYDRTCQLMARQTNRIVISVDYRLAPEYPFPEGVEDCYAVARELFQNPGVFGIEQRDITLIGDSAGGNLAAAVSLMALDRGEFLPRRQILLYPATQGDHTESSPFASVVENGKDYLLTAKRVCDYMALYERTPDDRENPYFSPLLHNNLHGQPATLIITAQYDPLRDEGEAYSKRLKTSGVYTEYYCLPDALHGFLRLPQRYEHVRLTYALMNRFLRREARLK